MCPGGPYQNPPGHIFYAGNFQKNQQGNRKQFPLLAFLICLNHFSFTVMSVLFFCFHTKNDDVRRILVIFLISVIVVVLVLSNIFYKTDALRMIKVYFVHGIRQSHRLLIHSKIRQCTVFLFRFV